MNNARKSLEKKAKKGFKGHPLCTVAYYGSTNKLATKIAVGIISYENAEPIMTRWYCERGFDIRIDTKIMDEVLKMIKNNEVCSVFITDNIIGCPHEEGVDFPDGESCQKCTYWLNRDRWTGKIIS